LVPRRVWVLVAVLVGVLLAGFVPASVSWADAALRSTDPRQGATLTAVPEAVTFTFNERLQGRFTTVTVSADGGAPVALAVPASDGEQVRQVLPATLPAGAYTVAYRVVSADGHPVAGDLRFTLDLPPAAAGAAPSRPPTSAVAAPAAPTAAGGGTWWLILGVIVLLVAGVLAAGRVRASARRPHDPAPYHGRDDS
jgi:methionine-rich copper-binding protein CopC